MLTIKKDDFVIHAANFDLTNEWNILRIIAGAFMFPHFASKFLGWEGTVGFFAKAGFAPPELWVYIAAAVEFISGAMLVLGLCTRFAGLAAAGALVVATYALFHVKGFGWLWNKGGFEYPIFWAITCLMVSLQQFKLHLSSAAGSVPFAVKASTY